MPKQMGDKNSVTHSSITQRDLQPLTSKGAFNQSIPNFASEYPSDNNLKIIKENQSSVMTQNINELSFNNKSSPNLQQRGKK